MDYQFGVDYYPEHWPRERWETDAALMKEMGVDVVRMAEFSWFKMEPRRGEFEFGWLDEAIELLAAHGIKSILGTPTAAPPAWIIQETPEIQPIDSQGRLRHFGGRHHDCQSNPVYREHIRRFVTAFAAHFGSNPNVIGWQIDNELGNSHGDLCMCPSCEKRFQEWLAAKYGDIETLNRRWGTAFWSQGYQDFSQIQAPILTVTGENPSEMLDWKRFCSDLVVEFHHFQAELLRTAAPDKFITHNLMGFSDKVSYFDLAKDLDFVSHDQYPGGHFRPAQNQLIADRLAAELDFIRGLKEKPFWIMEQQAGMTGWEVLGRSPRPGELGLWVMQTVAHGADTVVFFRWRTCSMGTEQYWHGVLPHSGIPGRYYRELKEFMDKARPLMKEIGGSMPKVRTAIVFSYDQDYAMQIQPHHPDHRYVEHLMMYYRALFGRNIPVDFIPDNADFGKYDLVIAPLQYLMTPELEQKYRAYVAGGGNLLLTMRTGVKDWDNICMTDSPLPGGLGDVLGIEVPEYDCLRDTSVNVSFAGEEYTGEKWSDLITLTTAEPLAAYSSEFYAGTPAVTVNRHGKGRAYYVGVEPGQALAAEITGKLVEDAGIASLGDSPFGVEITHRSTGEKDYIFLINHTAEIQTVKIPADWSPYFDGQTGELQPFAVEVYTRAGK